MGITGKPEENYTANPAAPVTVDAIELTVPGECAGMRLDQALARLLPDFSRSRLSLWVRRNQVSLDGEPALPRHKVWGGEKISVLPEPDPRQTAFRAQDIPISIVYEDETLLVVDKPAGLVVHPGSGNWQGTLLNALLQHAPALQHLPRAGIVHRLDKETSGLLVVAKTLSAQTALVRQLQARSVTREYCAVVHGIVARDGKVDAPIGRHPVQRTRMAVIARGKPAVTHYHVVERFAAATLLRCRLETGRTHQIRVHLHSIGHPLVGDPAYGKKSGGAIAQALRFPRQALHAEKLALLHPQSGKPMTWHAGLPQDMQDLIRTLRTQP
jgi:23S rRNA pseudouridine1911/1915/1917 synthase